MTPRGADLQELLRLRLRGFDVRRLDLTGRRHAAVAVVVTEEGHGADLPGLPQSAQWSDAPAMLVTRRAETLRSHAGQWALPGGRLDEDEFPRAGRLARACRGSGCAARRFRFARPVGRLRHAIRLRHHANRGVGGQRDALPQEAEVASIHRIPFTELLRTDSPLLNQVRGAENPVLRMSVGQRWIAASTAAFLYQFRELCLLGRSTRVAHFDQPVIAWMYSDMGGSCH